MTGEGQDQPTTPSAEALTDAIKHVKLIVFTLLTVAGLLAFFGATADVHGKAVAEAGKDPTVWELRKLRGDWDSERIEMLRQRNAATHEELHPDPLIGEMRRQLDSSRAPGEPSFDEKYPSVAAQLDEYGYRTLDNAIHRAEAKAKAEAKTEGDRAVNVLGLPLDAEALPVAGPGLLLLIQLYLFVHLRHLREWTAARQAKLDVPAPWVGVMDDRLARLITWIGLAVVPAIAAFVSGGGLLAMAGGMFVFLMLVSAGAEMSSIILAMFSVSLVLSVIGGLCVAALGYVCGTECERLTDALYGRPQQRGPIGRVWGRLRQRVDALYGRLQRWRPIGRVWGQLRRRNAGGSSGGSDNALEANMSENGEGTDSQADPDAAQADTVEIHSVGTEILDTIVETNVTATTVDNARSNDNSSRIGAT